MDVEQYKHLYTHSVRSLNDRQDILTVTLIPTGESLSRMISSVELKTCKFDLLNYTIIHMIHELGEMVDDK